MRMLCLHGYHGSAVRVRHHGRRIHQHHAQARGIVEHAGGHVIPGHSSVTEPITSFLARFASDAPRGR
jgi:hypothetical protein